MKTFEEKFTAWVDGELKGRELAEFEEALPRALDARLDKLAAHQIGELFRSHGSAPELTNGDFFNHQIMQKIEAEAAHPAEAPARRKFAWSLPRLAMAGAFSLLMAFGLFHVMIPKPSEPAAKGIVEVISLKGGDPSSNVSIHYSPPDDVNVVLIGETGMKPNADKHASPEKRKDK